MPFPNIEHVIYQKNTLEQVLCELRFPSILHIDTQLPAAFQDKIRTQYPGYQEKNEIFPIPPDIVNLLNPEARAVLPPSSRKIYEFSTSDKLWKVTLTRESLSLTSNTYSGWEDFKNHFDLVFKALIDIYSPVAFSRIGLRYQNVIVQSRFNLEASWSELLQPYIAGPLNTTVPITEAFQSFKIMLEENKSYVNVQHGIVEMVQTGEKGYLIDSDLFVEEEIEVTDAIKCLDEFNKTATNLFRWFISDKLHAAMGPIIRQTQ